MLCCCGLPLLYVAAMMLLPPVFAYRRRAVGRGRITAATVGLPFAIWGVGLAAGLTSTRSAAASAGSSSSSWRSCTCPPAWRYWSGR